MTMPVVDVVDVVLVAHRRMPAFGAMTMQVVFRLRMYIAPQSMPYGRGGENDAEDGHGQEHDRAADGCRRRTTSRHRQHYNHTDTDGKSNVPANWNGSAELLRLGRP